MHFVPNRKFIPKVSYKSQVHIEHLATNNNFFNQFISYHHAHKTAENTSISIQKLLIQFNSRFYIGAVSQIML